jgi:hypothetical protein
MSVDRNEHVRFSGAVTAQRDRRGDLVFRDANAAQERAAADRNIVTVECPFDSLTRFLAYVSVPVLSNRTVCAWPRV